MRIGIGVGIGFGRRSRRAVVRDSFNRADNAVLGNAETGQAWAIAGTITLGVVSNTAATTGAATGAGIAFAESSRSNGIRVSCDITWTAGASAGILIRNNGAMSDMFRLFIRDGNDLCFDRVVSNTQTRLLQINSGLFVSGNTYKLTAEILKDVTRVFLGAALVGTFSTPELASNTKVGLYQLRNTSTPVSVFDNFIVEEI
jgi:hypothetical protein